MPISSTLPSGGQHSAGRVRLSSKLVCTRLRAGAPALMIAVLPFAFFMTANSPELDALHARYARSFASKHAALLEAWQAFSATRDEPSARTLHDLVHRLAGSAPSYGYETL